MRDAGSTRERILDQAEALYGRSGLSDFSLRAITEGAGVNLAAINYHFRSRHALIKAMLLRVLQPIAVEREVLLQEALRAYPQTLKPTHVMACLVLPMVRVIVSGDEQRRIAFLQRTASDSDLWVREVISQAFGHAGAQFEQAFADSAPTMPREHSVWRSRLFANAASGSLENHNLIVMCEQVCKQFATSPKAIARTFGALAENVMNGNVDAVQSSVDSVFWTLRHTTTVSEIERSVSQHQAVQAWAV